MLCVAWLALNPLTLSFFLCVSLRQILISFSLVSEVPINYRCNLFE